MATIDNTEKLKRLLGADGFRFLEHILDAPERLLPHSEISRWSVSWGGNAQSGATYLDSRRRSLNLAIKLNLNDAGQATCCVLQATLQRRCAPQGVGKVEHTIDECELDIAGRAVQKAAQELRDRMRRARARRKRFVLWSVATAGTGIIALVIALPHWVTPRQQSKEAFRAQSCIVIRDEVVHDTPLRGQIEMELVIDRSLSRDGIIALLREKYAEAQSRKVFKYREHANSIWIYVFSSAAYARASCRQPVAMITKSPADEQPSISFDEQLYSQMSATPEVRHGLAENVRIEIYTELARANMRAYDEAEEAIPTDPEAILSEGDTIVLAHQYER